METFSFVLALGIFIISFSETKTAVTPIQQLLKFYPINANEYVSPSNLINQQQPVISENLVMGSRHRALPEWSNTLPNGWNNMFITNQRTNGYPLCVLRDNVTFHRSKRSGETNYIHYAGMPPYVINSAPIYPAIAENNYGASLYALHNHITPLPTPYTIQQVMAPGYRENYDHNAIVNCVVVLRRNIANTNIIPKPFIYPLNPEHSYPQMQSSSPPLAVYSNYPPQPYLYAPYAIPPLPANHPTPVIKPLSTIPLTAPNLLRNAPSVNNAANYPKVDSNFNVQYHQMLTKYYQELAKLYLERSLTAKMQVSLNTAEKQFTDPALSNSLNEGAKREKFNGKETEDIIYDDEEDYEDYDNNDKENAKNDKTFADMENYDETSE